MSLAIELNHAEKVFAPGVGVFDLSFQIEQGTILGMIGPSGCGKTTTIRLMTGLLAPSSGKIKVLSKDPTQFLSSDREMIGYIPQHFVLYPGLSVSENIHFMASLYGLGRNSRNLRMEKLLNFVDLTEAKDRLCKQISGGMQRRLMLASALMHGPRLIFADEPTAGIDPILRRRFWDYFTQLRDQGNTLIITTQYVGEAARCDHVAVMRRGKVLMVSTPSALRRTALGGELILLVVDGEQSQSVIVLLRKFPGVISVDRGKQEGEIQVLVNDSSSMLPKIIKELQSSIHCTIHKAEPYHPPFDDIFVKIMQEKEEVV